MTKAMIDTIIKALEERQTATAELFLKEAAFHDIQMGMARRLASGGTLAPLYHRYAQHCRDMAKVFRNPFTFVGSAWRIELIAKLEQNLELCTIAFRVCSKAMGLSQDEQRAIVEKAAAESARPKGSEDVNRLKRQQVS